MRTLKEQVLWVHRFRNLEQAREMIGEFIARYNRHWLIPRLGYPSPTQARASSPGESVISGLAGGRLIS